MPPPTNITNMFGNWIKGMASKTNARIRIGVCALVWAIWNCRNDIIFNRATVFAGYQQDYILDQHVVLSSPGGSAGVYGY
jgi:hypothetical protein